MELKSTEAEPVSWDNEGAYWTIGTEMISRWLRPCYSDLYVVWGNIHEAWAGPYAREA